MIAAVDTSDAKLEMARQFGATHVVNSRNEENVVKAILKLTEGGADYAFECVGSAKSLRRHMACWGRAEQRSWWVSRIRKT
jgi:Zn-dependent alcohol dehydrogenase